MAVSYKLYQNKNSKSKTFGQWYARATMTNVTDLSQIADRVQRNCSMKKSDVLAVLTEMVEVMRDELQASHRVKINGLGSFKIGLKTSGTATAKEFTASKNVLGMKVLFLPEVTVDAGHKRVKSLLLGATVKEYGQYVVTDEDASEDNGESNEANEPVESGE